MVKRNLIIAIVAILSMLFCAVSASAQPVPKAPGGIAKTLKGMDITIGNYWSDYIPASYKPKNDYEEKQLDYRKRLIQQYGFKMQEKMIASWGEMPSKTAISIMAGKPAASVFVLEARWALSLHRQKLLYPLSKSKAIDFKAIKPVEWNRTVTQAFTFDKQVYAFTAGYGGSQHAQVVFFNKRLFREAGLDENLLYDLQKSGQWTWDKFLEISRQLTRDTNNDGIKDTYAMTSDLSTEILDAFVASNGANYVDKDPKTGRLVNATGTPGFIEAIRFFMRLRDEGVLKPRTSDSAPWDWYKAEFLNGRVAMFIEPHYYATNDFRNMKDNWGMVLPPKGPRKSFQYTVYNDENVMVIPAKGYTDAQVDAILWAVQAWMTPVDDDWKKAEYTNYRDKRAVDETLAMIRDANFQTWKYHIHVPGLERGDITWQVWWHDGEPAQLIEAVKQKWDDTINAANF